MKPLTQRYYIGRYVTIWESDGANHKGELLLKEGCSHPKITVGKELVINPVCDVGCQEPQIDLGIITQGQNYKKNETVEILCDGNWYIVEFNRSLATMLERFGDQSDIFD
ncbi:MAG: hypothetical protein RRY33_07200 [Alistipes sp.]